MCVHTSEGSCFLPFRNVNVWRCLPIIQFSLQGTRRSIRASIVLRSSMRLLGTFLKFVEEINVTSIDLSMLHGYIALFFFLQTQYLQCARFQVLRHLVKDIAMPWYPSPQQAWCSYLTDITKALHSKIKGRKMPQISKGMTLKL